MLSSGDVGFIRYDIESMNEISDEDIVRIVSFRNMERKKLFGYL